MIFKIIATATLAIASGIFGRMGGSDKYNAKWRDAGDAIIVCLLLGIWGGFHWTLIPVFGMMWGSLSTYFKKKGEPVRWYNWLIVGAMFCLATIPYVWAMGLWAGFGLRFIILPPLIMLWCVLIGNAVVEELGRYFLLAITIPLLFLFKRKDK